MLESTKKMLLESKHLIIMLSRSRSLSYAYHVSVLFCRYGPHPEAAMEVVRFDRDMVPVLTTAKEHHRFFIVLPRLIELDRYFLLFFFRWWRVYE